MRRIGIMGGTFDPIHNGHLAAAEAASEAFDLEQVVFVPAGIPPHKAGVVTPGWQRLAMVDQAIKNKLQFRVSDFEIVKSGISYTIDTVAEFHSRYGPETEIYFITGADAFLEIITWKDIRRLMEMCRFIAVTRPGYAGAGLAAEIDKLPIYVQNRVNVLEVPGMQVSSTDVRAKISANQSVQGLVPTVVAEYIYEHNLYPG
ncbi:MAG: nicotinate-nucleotide adenylyltransferase [Peptococcaceae bacterium]|nr:nicotinate-nucleotide adenylyltransferase [Peptococcaceae bacterium]